MVLRSVCCRGGRSCAPPVKIRKEICPAGSTNRASMVCGESKLIRAAASSIASGSPSRRAQISATALAFWSSTTKSPLTAFALSTNRETAGDAESVSKFHGTLRFGTSSGGTLKVCSPRTCSGARLVTRTFRCGDASISVVITVAAVRMCSRPSSTSSILFSHKYSVNRDSNG